MLKWFLRGGLLGVVFALAAGCGDTADEAVDEVSNTVDCAQICNKYDSCVSDIDETACTDQCEDLADQDDNYEAAASSCEDCLSDKSCTDAESCWAGCPAVPASD